MHTLIATAIGLGLLGLLIGLAKDKAACASRFIVMWFFICLLHLSYGVWGAGYPLLTELGVHVIVFGLPGGAAWLLARKLKPRA